MLGLVHLLLITFHYSLSGIVHTNVLWLQTLHLPTLVFGVSFICKNRDRTHNKEK